MYIQSIIEGNYFHIYNRGVNGENLFKKKEDYYYFLDRYEFYCSEILDTIAYCLMKNHFHLVAFVKENIEVPRRDGKGMFRLNASKQLGHLFNCFAQTMNFERNRTGPLFESPFEGKLIADKGYLHTMIHYCHHNPVHHGFVQSAEEWEFSSYRSILGGENKLIDPARTIALFKDKSGFEESYKVYRKGNVGESVVEEPGIIYSLV